MARDLVPPILLSRVALIFLCAFVVLAACDRGPDLEPSVAEGAEAQLFASSPGRPCEIASAAPNLDSVVVIGDQPSPCRIYFRETGVVLRGDVERHWPDPGRSLARDSRGRFTSTVAGDNARLAVWSPSGEFLQTVGRAGQGPGEIPPGLTEPALAVDGRDRLFVRSSGGVWTIFGPEFDFRGKLSVVSGKSAVMSSGLIVSGGAARGEPRMFHITDSTGTRLRSFGMIADTLVRKQDVGITRGVTAVGDSLFWADPVHNRLQGYTLELWSVTGRRVTTLRRNAPWFADRESVAAGDPPAPTVAIKSVDGDRLLIVYVWNTNSSWSWTADQQANRTMMQAAQNVHIEVLDWWAGKLLASAVVPLSAITNGRVPLSFVPGTRLAYLPEVVDGNGRIRIFQLEMVKREKP